MGRRVWRDHELRPSYDVVIIGGGVHGLAAAYPVGTAVVAVVAIAEATP